MLVSTLILALTLGGLVVQLATRARTADGSGSVTVHSIRQRREILKAAKQFFAEGGWALTTTSRKSAVFSHQVRPSRPMLVILLLLGILPGVLALIIGRKTLTVTVNADEDNGGSATLVSWSSTACEPACRDFALMIRMQEPERHGRRSRRVIRRRRRAA